MSPSLFPVQPLTFILLLDFSFQSPHLLLFLPSEQAPELPAFLHTHCKLIPSLGQAKPAETRSEAFKPPLPRHLRHRKILPLDKQGVFENMTWYVYANKCDVLKNLQKRSHASSCLVAGDKDADCLNVVH